MSIGRALQVTCGALFPYSPVRCGGPHRAGGYDHAEVDQEELDLRNSACLTALLGFCALSFVEQVGAQSFQVPSRPQHRPAGIINAVIHPVTSDPIELGYILFDEGRITAIGIGVFHPTGDQNEADYYDAKGMHVYPGLISSDSTVGLLEIGAVRATNDLAEVSSVNMSPEAIAATAVNPDSAIIPVTRANGILTALVAPQGNLISGYASLIRLDGWTNDELTIRARAGLVVRWPGLPNPNDFLESAAPGEGGGGGRRGGRGGGGGGFEEAMRNATEQMRRIDRAFRDAAAYLQSRQANPDQAVDIRLEAFRPVLEKSAPLFIHVNGADEIRASVAWAQRMGLKPIVVGGQESDQCVDFLKSAGASVVVAGTHRMPFASDATYDQAFTIPLALWKGGVPFCIASGEETAHERSLPYHAATAAAFGLPVDEAIKALTIYPAQILGISETHGSIEVGKAATLIVTTGNPLEVTTLTEMAFIEGSPVDLTTRHTQFYEKYLERARQYDESAAER